MLFTLTELTHWNGDSSIIWQHRLTTVLSLDGMTFDLQNYNTDQRHWALSVRRICP